MRGSGIKHIFTEDKLFMGQRQLGQQCGCNVMLRAIDVNAPRLSDGTAHHQQRYPVAFYRQIVDMFGISSQVVWNKHNHRILPLGKLTELSYKITCTTIRIGKGVQPVILQTTERYFKRLVAAGGLQDTEMRSFLFCSSFGSFGFQVFQQTVEYEMVVRPPLT